MKLISARQAWHDCFYSMSKSQMDGVVEQEMLGCAVQHTSKINTCNVAAHQTQAGLIQSAIATLPPPLQTLGHWLYAPEGFIPTGAENAIWKMLAVLCGVDDEDFEEWYLVRCSLHRYRELAWQRPEGACTLNTPRKIKGWLMDWHGIDMDTRRWARKQSVLWDRFIKELDDMDRKLLAPITEVIAEAKDDVSEEDTFEWDNRLVAMRAV